MLFFFLDHNFSNASRGIGVQRKGDGSWYFIRIRREVLLTLRVGIVSELALRAISMLVWNGVNMLEVGLDMIY